MELMKFLVQNYKPIDKCNQMINQHYQLLEKEAVLERIYKINKLNIKVK